ncbi:MAG TPA: phytoene/squalene synthase family protein [Bacteroidales bacterium]|nr:phytoene/squalene synthase family protein [Bacteroidales bacterium]HRR92981.1 phytoene/squalene synthase family protein [Bacteroidales bacterium]HRT89275.1 phytoene/squalene synthase family protein [Bacteroidales bacterium]
MNNLYNDLTVSVSRLVTRKYSTSFSIAVSLLERETRDAIYSVYGFVRFADEIVDSFHKFDKARLLKKFEEDYYEAVNQGISLNPILNSFQNTVRKYNIPDHLVQAFLKSMKYDLGRKEYVSEIQMDEYIYGSAEVVGLMCLRIFLRGDEEAFQTLSEPARRLGAAFQKVNFLRDLRADMTELGRRYFPDIIHKGLDEDVKADIIADIRNDFAAALPGIRKLPSRARLGVLTAYLYYLKLLKRIKSTPAGELAERRIRVPDAVKLLLLARAFIMNKLNLI